MMKKQLFNIVSDKLRYGYQENIVKNQAQKKILKSIQEIFTIEELDRFGSYAVKKLREGKLAVECENYNSYEIEIPSVLRTRGFGKHPETDPENKIPRLIKLLSEELKK